MQINQFDKSKGHVVGNRRFNFPVVPVPVIAPLTFDPTKADTDFELTDNNTTVNCLTASTMQTAIGTDKAVGKVYAEMEINDTNTAAMMGICNASHLATQRAGFTNNSWSWMSYAGGRLYHSSSYSTTGSTDQWVQNDILQVAIDLPNNKVWYGRNNTWIESGDPANGTNPTFEDANIMGDIFLLYGCRYVDDNVTLVGLLNELNYTPPSGFSAWGG